MMDTEIDKFYHVKSSKFMRYKSRCYLRLYYQKELEAIFEDTGQNFVINQLGRDYLVVVKH